MSIVMQVFMKMLVRVIIINTAMAGGPPDIWGVMLRVVAREYAALKCIDISAALVGFMQDIAPAYVLFCHLVALYINSLPRHGKLYRIINMCHKHRRSLECIQLVLYASHPRRLYRDGVLQIAAQTYCRYRRASKYSIYSPQISAARCLCSPIVLRKLPPCLCSLVFRPAVSRSGNMK
jgi:hypothetical protein